MTADSRKWLLLIFLLTGVSVLLVAIVGWQSYRVTETAALEEFNERQLVVAKGAAAGVQHSLKDAIREVRELASGRGVKGFDEALAREAIAIEYEWLNADTNDPHIVDIVIEDAGGIIKFAEVARHLEGTDSPWREYVQEVSRAGSGVGYVVELIDLPTTEGDGRGVVVAVPIFAGGEDGSDEFAGAVVMILSFESITSQFIASISDAGAGSPMLISNDNEILWSLDEEARGKDLLAESRDFAEFSKIASRMAAGEAGAGEYTYYKFDAKSGRNLKEEEVSLVAYAPVRLGNWYMSVAVSTPREQIGESFSSVTRMQLTLVGSIIFIIFVGSSTALGLTARTSSMLEHDVKEKTNELVENEESQSVISSLLRLSLEDIPSEQLFASALDLLFCTPWIPFADMGAIFALNEESGAMEMKAQAGLSGAMQAQCAEIKRGECYCGRAAETREIQFVGTHGWEVEKAHDSGGDHSHYSVPIVFAEEVLGVLNVYLEPSHEESPREREFLTAVANTLAGIMRRKRSDQARDRSEEHYRSLVESSSDCICDISLDGNFVSMNSAGRRFNEVDSPEELIGEDCTAAIIENREMARAAIERTARGETVDLQYKSRAKSGREIWWHANLTPIRAPDGTIISILRVSRDVTESKYAEEEIRFKSLLLDNATDAVFALEPEGRIVFVNQSACDSTGYSESELTSMSITEFVPTDHRAALGKALKELVKRSASVVINAEHETKEGLRFPVEIKARQIEVGGQPLTIAVARDITERKQAEQAMARQASELARSNEDLEQFAYVASHDLQEPLRMVSSYVQLLAKRYRGRLDSDADEFIEFAVDGAARMKRLIDDLLAYSRVRPDTAELAKVDCEEILERALKNLESAITESRAKITHGPLPSINGDATTLAQLFQNLLSNAIKFSPGGAPQIDISAENVGGAWRFSVHDNGIGIDPGSQDRIFLLFQRLHHKSDYSGTGIGLAMCKRIVERHGGRMWVDSELGQGSTFFFTIADRSAVGANVGAPGA